MKKIIALLIVIVTLSNPDAGRADTKKNTDGRVERVQLVGEVGDKVIKGRLKGRQYVDYHLHAGAGQTLAVALTRTHPQNFFNILPPGTETAMFVGQSGNNFKELLPVAGDYTIRVYLMRPAARRNASSRYTLTVSLTGKTLEPVAASIDALIPGTPFHASTTIDCPPRFDGQPQKCEAFVIRYGFDGTATVEVRDAQGIRQRILFVKGKPVASDSTEPVTFSRKGDVSDVRLGEWERFDVPDVLVFGG
ncbi:MAG: hypothetical protein IPQ16_09195 [Geobacteraceae bacterium]|nr:hypothetical protein [Geobacteraceae bacterium]